MRNILFSFLLLFFSINSFAQVGGSPIGPKTREQVVSKTTTYTATTSDQNILVSASGGSWSLSFPTAVGQKGKCWFIKRTDSTPANSVTLDPSGAQTIDGVSTLKLWAQYESLEVCSDNTNLFTRNYYGQPSIELYVSDITGHGSTATKVPLWTTIDKALTSDYLTFTQDATNGDKVTVNVPGLYHVQLCASQAAGGEEFAITINNAQSLATSVSTLTYAQGKRCWVTATTGVQNCCNLIWRFAASDIIRFQDQGQGDSNDAFFSIIRLGQ